MLDHATLGRGRGGLEGGVAGGVSFRSAEADFFPLPVRPLAGRIFHIFSLTHPPKL